MDWSDERYVRLYTRDTATWNSLEWEGQTVLMHLLRKVDRAGVMDFEDDVADAVRHITRLPAEVIAVGLPKLIQKKVVEVTGSTLVFPNFLEAQEAKASERQRSAEYRARRRDLARRGVTRRDGHSTDRDDDSTKEKRGALPPTKPPVTPSDEATTPGGGNTTARSQTVTPSLAQPSRTVPDRSLKADPKTAASDAREQVVTTAALEHGPERPVRKRDLLTVTVEASGYVPLPEHEQYAGALGLSPGEYQTTLGELVDRFAPRGVASLHKWDERFSAFLESSATNKKTRRGSSSGRPSEPIPENGKTAITEYTGKYKGRSFA